MTTLSRILESKIVAIVRGAQPEHVPDIAEALYEGGVRILEITLNSRQAISVIATASAKLGSRMVVGAGTVLDAATARAVIDAGAAFILSPTVDAETIHMAKRYGLVSIPGAFTPTEILQAYTYGGDIVKVFPARMGPGYIADILGPLPQIPLMPTGGVNLENVRAFLQAGAVSLGIGGALVDTKQPVTPAYLRQLTEKARQYVAAISNL